MALTTQATAPEQQGSSSVLACEGLVKSFGDFKAVKGISFHISEGETYGLLGPNGAGKTTTIAMICGLLDCDAGDVRINGENLTVNSVGLKGRIGYVPQDLAIYPDLTARENASFFARLYDIPRREMKSRIAEVLELIGLSDRANDLVKTYSGGMKRRLNIGIGLIHRPDLLVLDEPTAGVDPQSRNAILESVGRLSKEGMAVLYTTHYMEEAERLCDRVGIIDSGELIAEGTRRELVSLVGQHDRVHITATGDLKAGAAALRELAAVREATGSSGSIDLIVDQARNVLPELFPLLSAADVIINSIDVSEPDLEAVFLHMTGKGLRN